MVPKKNLFLHPGARAHYLLPRALAKKGLLSAMITDHWFTSFFISVLSFVLPSSLVLQLKGRYHKELQDVPVFHLGIRALWKEFRIRKQHPDYGWEQVMIRDQYFKVATEPLVAATLQSDQSLIGLAYTSKNAFQLAKQKGATTILYQMDPGLAEETYIDTIIRNEGHDTSWKKAPAKYWKEWKEECALADTILVNSEWSKNGLIQQGIPASKIKLFPLPIDILPQHRSFKRYYPDNFSKTRPLRVLFLGTLMIRKGIHILLQAARQVEALPIEFILVGRTEIDTSLLQNFSNITYKGIVPRAQVHKYYQTADVFLFPTLSDGFGLTQLEAMAWKLPVINTRHCAQVVNEASGWTLTPNNAEELISLLNSLVHSPSLLSLKSDAAFEQVETYSLDTFASTFTSILHK